MDFPKKLNKDLDLISIMKISWGLAVFSFNMNADSSKGKSTHNKLEWK